MTTWITDEMIKQSRSAELKKIAVVVRNYRRTGKPGYFIAAQCRLALLDPYLGERFASIRYRIPLMNDASPLEWV